MERYRGRVAMVTGASSGIGAAIVHTLLRHGVVVVGLARRLDRIKALEDSGSPGKLYALQGDVTKEEDILSAFKWIKEKLGGVDIMINNAGIGADSDLTEVDTTELRRVFDTNVIGLGICIKEAVKGMRERGVDDGYIINIGSIAGHEMPSASNIAVYSASKFAVRVLNEGLRKDLASSNSNIRNTMICPGPVRTEMHESLRSSTAEKISKLRRMEAEDIAECVVFVLSRPIRVQINDIIVYPTGTVLI